MIPPDSVVVRRGLFRLLMLRAAVNAGYTAYLLLDRPATYAVLLPSLATYGLLDGIAACAVTGLLYRFRPREPYWMSSLADGISRLGLAGIVLLVPEVVDHPLFLLLHLSGISIVAVLNGLMCLLVAASLRQGGARSRLANWFMLLGIVSVAAGVLLILPVDPSMRKFQVLLPIMFGVTAITMGIAAARMLRGRDPL